MTVCHCHVISDRDVCAAVDTGARTVAQVCAGTGAGTDCGGCVFTVPGRGTHADWFESQLDTVRRLGAPNYLAQQLDPSSRPS